MAVVRCSHREESRCQRRDHDEPYGNRHEDEYLTET